MRRNVRMDSDFLGWVRSNQLIKAVAALMPSSTLFAIARHRHRAPMLFSRHEMVRALAEQG